MHLKNNSKRLRRLSKTVAAAFFFSMAVALPAETADKIYFDYGYLSRSISTASLETFVEDGVINDELAPYISAMSASSRQELQQFLGTPLPAINTSAFGRLSDPFVLSQWLHTPMGDLMLTRIGALIQTQGRRNGRQAIRGALVSAAAAPDGLSVINVIRHYPTEAVRLNLLNILALSRSISDNQQATEQLVSMAADQSETAATQNASVDYRALPVLSEMTPFEVTKQSLVLDDQRRERTYAADLYLPSSLQISLQDTSAEPPIPVMLISHGYGDDRHLSDTVTLAESLAAHGFAVAVLEHIGSNRDYRRELSRGLTHESFDSMAFIDRPLDITFLLDTLVQKNSAEFQNRLQLDRVGVIGRSLGGYTALAVAGATIDIERLQHQCDPEAAFTPDTVNMALLVQCRSLELAAYPETIQRLTDGSLKDDRVSLVMASAPLTNLFGPQGMSLVDAPVVMLGGAHDMTAPIVPEQMYAFQWLQTERKYFYIAENTAHTPEMSRFILNMVHSQGDIVGSFDQSERALFRLTVSLMIAHGKVHLLGDESYRPYLSAAYVEAVSPEPTRFHLLRVIP